MDWLWTVAQWCFFGFFVFVLFRVWAYLSYNNSRLRFMEEKIDALLDDNDIDFMARFRDRIAMVLRKSGKDAATTECFFSTGWNMKSAVSFVENVAAEDEEKSGAGDSSEMDMPSSLAGMDADEVHELVDQVFRRPVGRPKRRKRR